MIQNHLGDNDTDARGRVPLGLTEYFPLLDQIVGQQFTGDFLDVFKGEIRGLYAVPFGSVYGTFLPQVQAQPVLDGLDGGGAGVVLDPRPVPHPDDPVAVERQRVIGGYLGYRVGKHILLDGIALSWRQVHIQGVDLDHPHVVKLDAKIVFGFLLDSPAFGIGQVGPDGNLESVWHGFGPQIKDCLPSCLRRQSFMKRGFAANQVELR